MSSGRWAFPSARRRSAGRSRSSLKPRRKAIWKPRERLRRQDFRELIRGRKQDPKGARQIGEIPGCLFTSNKGTIPDGKSCLSRGSGVPALVKKANTRPRLIGSAPVDRPTASEQPRFAQLTTWNIPPEKRALLRLSPTFSRSRRCKLGCSTACRGPPCRLASASREAQPLTQPPEHILVRWQIGAAAGAFCLYHE